mgnify:CR=1 FL=1
MDKYYRIQRNLGWFNNEQLSEKEMEIGKELIEGYDNEFDIVLSHTCPKIYQPTDLFMPIIDQSSVDDTMERYLGEIEIDDTFTWTMDSNENWAGNRFTCQNIPSLGVTSSTTFTNAYNNYASIGNVSDYTSHLNVFILRYVNNRNRIDL